MRDPGFIQLLDRLRVAKRVLLVSDGRPDGDSLGSTTASYQWLARDYPHLQLSAFCQERTPPSLLCLNAILQVKNDPRVFLEPWDLIILHDAGDLSHAGIKEHLPHTPAGYTLVDIDHHATNTRYGDLNIVQTDASATTQVFYRCFKEHGIRLTPDLASSLLAGLLTDTGAFGNSGTTAESLAMASDLLRLGARYQEIMQSTLSRQSVESFHLWGKALARLKKDPALDMATTYFFAEDYAAVKDEEATNGLSNMLNATCGDAEAIMVLKETADGLIKGSVRSTKRDISKFCQALGGGGHKKAAGFTVPGALKKRADGTVELIEKNPR